MDYQKLAQLLFPDIYTTRETWEEKYPPRMLSAGAKVTRIGPSPTGFIHLGNLYNALIGELSLIHISRITAERLAVAKPIVVGAS